MLTMILQMTGVTALYILLTFVLWKWTRNGKLSRRQKLLIGLVYGGASVLSTHFSIDYSHMLLNVRDLGPLTASLFFDPWSGIIAGLIGGVERYIAGTYWGIGSYTRIACSVSTCLAGFLAAGLRIWILRNKKPSAVFAFILGAVMEVFHMYVALITHRDDMEMAMYVVRTCSGPMIVFTGLGLSASSVLLRLLAGEWVHPFRVLPRNKISLSQKFQFWLFLVTLGVLLLNLLLAFMLQTQSALQDARDMLASAAGDVRAGWEKNPGLLQDESLTFRVSREGSFDILSGRDTVVAGAHKLTPPDEEDLRQIAGASADEYFTAQLFGRESFCLLEELDETHSVLVTVPTSEIYSGRMDQMLEIAFSDIILFAVIYSLISLLVQEIVVNNLGLVNDSLGRITGGNLNEVVNVRGSSEFSSLSDDINMTVSTLKSYIAAAEKRMEEELEFARVIQDSALPKNFSFPRSDFELYALMDPAREVGGDFYDFFFVDRNKLALVIADVSGKGIPAALFMMQAKTAIRGLAESCPEPTDVLFRANNVLCEGNDAEMFVTVWLGIIDLQTGRMKCASAGHEYPVLMPAGGSFALLKDRHGLPLAAMQDTKYRAYDLEFKPGDRIFVYTDGVPEAIDPGLQAYGTGRLVGTLNSAKTAPQKTLLTAVHKDLQAFQGTADQFDDITMLGFTYLGGE